MLITAGAKLLDFGLAKSRAPALVGAIQSTWVTPPPNLNDPAKRLIVVANFDNDVAEYGDWSGGFFPFDASNEAYKVGVNYMIYGLTH